MTARDESMLDDVLIVFPPGGGAKRKALVLVEFGALVSSHLTALTFRCRAEGIQRALSDAEKDEFAARQGMRDEEVQEFSRLFSDAARQANRHFHILEAEPDDIADRVCILSRPYPLSIISLGDDLKAEFDLLSMVLYVAWRPVLVVPTTARRRGPLGRAVVAWSGTQQSARALAFAPHAFDAGSRVDIVSVGSGSKAFAAENEGAIAALRGGGITVAEVGLNAREDAVAEEINEYVMRTQAELLLIGAPSRRSQMDFNLASIGSQLLQTSPVPVLVHP
jgi:nucleotide-binding universal stress UspA family protein